MNIDDEILEAGRRQAGRPVDVPDPRRLVGHRRRNRRATLLSVGAVPVLVLALVVVGTTDESPRENAVTAEDTSPDNAAWPTTPPTSSALPEWAVDGDTVPDGGPPAAFDHRRDDTGRILATLIDGRTMATEADDDLRLSEATPRVTTTAAFVDTRNAFELTVLWGTIDQNFGGRPIRRVIDRGAHGGLLLGGPGDVRLVVEIEGWTVSIASGYLLEDRQDLIVEALDGSIDPASGFLRLTASDDIELDYTEIDDSAGYFGPVLRLIDDDADIQISPARCDVAIFEESADGGYVMRCDPASDVEIRVQVHGRLTASDIADGLRVDWRDPP